MPGTKLNGPITPGLVRGNVKDAKLPNEKEPEILDAPLLRSIDKPSRENLFSPTRMSRPDSDAQKASRGYSNHHDLPVFPSIA
jgi:hypothetical protein